MKQLRYVLTGLLFFLLTNCHSQQSPDGSSVLGVFIASTPCSTPSKPLPGMASNTDCELMKWKLTLYTGANNKTPTTFKLHCTYGMSKQGSTGFIGGGQVVDLEGNWAISKGTAANPNATTYLLTDAKTNKTISFIKFSDDVLHLLDDAKQLMKGNAAWSYTLNRMVNQ